MEFDVTYKYAEDGQADSSRTVQMGELNSVLPRGLKGAHMWLADGDTLEYTSAEGLFTVIVKARAFKRD